VSEHPVPHSRPWLTESECAAMREVCISGTVASDERAAAFAAQAAALVRRTHGLLTMTGTQALTLAIRALCLPPGAEVIIPTYV
jgi:perosamine synthetase